MDEKGITVVKLRGDQRIIWEDIELIDEIDWLWGGTIFKVRPKNSKTFYFHADKPRMSLKDMFNGGFKTEMAEYVSKKKQEFGI